MKTTFALLSLAFVCQQAVADAVRHASVHDGVLDIVTDNGRYTIRPYSKKIVETRFEENGGRDLSASHAVVMIPQKIGVTFREHADALDFDTGGMAVHVNRSPLQITYRYHEKTLLEERAIMQREGMQVLEFGLDHDEALYGGGARALGMNRRGNRLPLYNKAHYGYEQKSEQMNFSMPLVFSSKQYGIHFDNPMRGFLDLDSTHDDTLRYETIGGRKVYQVVAGDDWDDVVASYTALTGHQPLPPRWALGHFASRFGYHSEAEARTVIERTQAEQIPLDAIVLDLYWFGKDIKGTMGNLAFDHDQFPDPQRMVADFAAKGVKTVLVTEPFVLTTSQRWQEAVSKGVLAKRADGQPYTYDFYFGHTGLIDIFDPASRDWFWNIYKDLKKIGVAGWWGDLGEPEVHPADLQHVNGSADQVHNIYGHAWAQMIADGYRKEFPHERPFILMRAGYSGSQRFGLIPWSGDVSRTWGGLQSQPEIALQMGMQGMAYMHSDLGGFAGANLDDELYVRWLQYGVFQPVFRPHAQEEVPSEAVYRADKARVLAKQAIALRYRMLPYNYTLAFENSRNGQPLMRPLFFAEPDNAKLFGDASSYLWGRDLLVHPVTQKGQREVQQYFPRQSAWFDFGSDEKHTGGSTDTLILKEDRIPVFVRAGAFVPMAQPMQNTSTYNLDRFALHYWHDTSVSHSEGMLYDDDGMQPDNFQAGRYAIYRFHSRFDHDHLHFDFTSAPGKHFAIAEKTAELIIHNVNARPLRVRVGKRDVPFAWDVDTRQLRVSVPFKVRAAVEVALAKE